MATVSDQQLIQQIQQGRREALAQLFDRYSADLYDFLARVVGDRDEAARLLEEVFTRVPGAVAGMPTRESVRGWLYSLAREAALNSLRQKGWLDSLPPADEPLPAGIAGEIWKAARAMPAFHRAVLVVEELHALSPTEKARALGVQRTDLARLVDEARKSFVRQFDAQARAEGRPTSSQIDSERILGLQRRIPSENGSLFGLLPVLVMPDSLQHALRRKVIEAMTTPPPREPVQVPPAESEPPVVPPTEPIPQPTPVIVPPPVITSTTTTRTRRFRPATADGFNPTAGALAALIGVVLALSLCGIIFLFTRDTSVPVIERVEPRDGSSVPLAPLITVLAQYRDDREVDTNNTKLSIDGSDISALSTKSQNAISYSGPLALGAHVAMASVVDRTGNKRETSWRFSVVPAPTATPTETPFPTFVFPTVTPFPTVAPLATATPRPPTIAPLPTSTAILATATPCLVGITGKAYNDSNGNQTRDGGEPNLAGVTINLQNAGGGTIAVAITDSFGTYQFANLSFGTYRVNASVPAGWFSTTPTIVTVNMLGCGAFLGVDFGFNQSTPTPPPSTTPTVTQPPTQTPIVITATPPSTTTATNTPTNTFTPSNTPTVTNTPTATNTLTPTPTPSVTQVLAQINIAGPGNGSIASTCPSGSRITGGGFGHNGSLEVYVSTIQGNAWLVSARKPAAGSAMLNVYAICVSNLAGTTAGFPQSVSIGPAGTGQAVTNCPSSQILTGGGFSASTLMEVYGDGAQGNGWQSAAQNNNVTNKSLFAVAVCYNGAGNSTIMSLPVSLPMTTSGTATIACPSGRLVTGGGYDAAVGVLVNNSSQLANGWQATANNTTGGPQVLTVYAVCTSF